MISVCFDHRKVVLYDKDWILIGFWQWVVNILARIL